MARTRIVSGLGRTLAASAMTLGATFAAFVVPTGAQEPSEQPAEVGPGRGEAGATILSVGPSTGGLELAVTTGQARAATSGSLAESLSRSVSLGLIGSALTAGGCDGGDPLIDPGALPQALRIDNRNGPASAESTEVPAALPALGVGHEAVSADDTPAARAASTLGPISLGPLLSLRAGESVAESEVLPGRGREARASVSVDVDLAGVLSLTGLRWDARHQTGAEPSAIGGFELAGLSIAGAPVPLDLSGAGLDALGQTLDAALAPLGLRLELPRIVRITEPVDLIRVTPLRLVLADGPLTPAVRPALELTRELRSQLFDALVSAECSLASALLIGDVVTGVAAGTGSLILELGGVEASSSELTEENLLGGLPEGLSGDVSPPDLAGPARQAGPLPTTPPATVPGAVRPVHDQGPVDRLCETVHPRGTPSCSVGAATVVGAVGTAGTAGLAALDLRRRRRLTALVRGSAGPPPGAAP